MRSFIRNSPDPKTVRKGTMAGALAPVLGEHTIPCAVVLARSVRTHASAAVRRSKTNLITHSRQLSAQMATVGRSPSMELAESSGPSTPPDREPVMNCRLVLTTLSGVAINVSLSIAKFDRFEDLEDHVMDFLVSVTDLKVFGCSIEFLHLATQTYLEDPIWDKLQQSMEYCIIFKDCSEVLPSQELLEGYPIHKIPLAVHVPMNPEGVVPEGVSIEPGIRLIGPEAWQSRRQLRIVKLPATVVGISDNAFRSCKLLNSVAAPGCREFGYKAFDECCSLQWVYTAEGVANQLAAPPSLGIPSFEHTKEDFDTICGAMASQLARRRR